MLPPIRNPFPVNEPFKTEVNLHKLGRPLLDEQPEETLFLLDAQYEALLTEKVAMLTAFPQHSLCYLTDDLADLEACLWQTAAAIARDLPQYTACDADGFRSLLLAIGLSRDGQLDFEPAKAYFPALATRCYEHLQTLPRFERLACLLAYSIAEDVAVIRNTGGGARTDQAECFIVALPSHWDPAEKLGLNFSDIHQPVADNAGLKKSHPSLLKAMIHKGPFVRYGWSLPNSAALAHNPTLSQDSRPTIDPTCDGDALLDSLYFRVERQTFLNLPTWQRGVFLIRIYQRPLRAALTTPQRATRLANSIASMSPAMLAYKSLSSFAPQLISALRQVEAG